MIMIMALVIIWGWLQILGVVYLILMSLPHTHAGHDYAPCHGQNYDHGHGHDNHNFDLTSNSRAGGDGTADRGMC